LNPLSASQWPFISNPQRFGGEDAFILGIRGASTTVGPWMTEGDYGPGLMLAALPGGDLAVTAQGNGYVAFNGGQTLLEQAGSVLFRLDTTTGHVVWRTPLAQPPSSVITAPGGRIAVLNQPSGSAPNVQLYEGTNGELLSTLPLPPTSSHPVLAAGQTDLFVLGDYSSAFDFDPGTGTDQPSGSRGVYISRYSF
jgi:outer membrane protein assembly factor BamB